MKKYKLIKEYPGSPELGMEIIGDKLGYNRVDKNIPLKNWVIPLDIERWTQYWQEVIEKDYEILSFKLKNNNTVIFFKKENGNYATELKYPGSPEKLMLENNAVEIHSIKRLSDGEVFTVGSNYILRQNKGNVISPIKEIKLINNIPTIITESNNTIFFDSWTNISQRKNYQCMKKLKHIAFNAISILAIITCILYILNHFNTQMNMGHWLILIILEAAIQTVIELNIRT